MKVKQYGSSANCKASAVLDYVLPHAKPHSGKETELEAITMTTVYYTSVCIGEGKPEKANKTYPDLMVNICWRSNHSVGDFLVLFFTEGSRVAGGTFIESRLARSDIAVDRTDASWNTVTISERHS